MKPLKKTTIGELAAYVCSFLNAHGIKFILSGGACVSIYTNNKYESFDLDFIENGYTPRKEIREILNKIGFKEENRYFVHKETKYFIEFPSGPLSAGSEPILDSNEIEFETGKLFLLTPTDCVKDRLAAYYHWDDKQALEQAVLVVENHIINLNEIRRWSKAEKKLEQFESIKRRITRKK